MNDSVENPYRAPRAAVFDIHNEEERGPRPVQAGIAVALLWVTLVLQAAGLTFLWRLFRLFTPFMFVAAGMLTVIWILMAFLVAMIERGRNWARITYLVLFLLGLPFSVLSIIGSYQEVPLLSLSGVVQGLLGSRRWSWCS